MRSLSQQTAPTGAPAHRPLDEAAGDEPASSRERGDACAAPTTDVAGYRRVREASVELASPLSAEDAALQSMPDASPTKWHLAHTSWFFETFLLRKELAGYTDPEPAYAHLFNSYYNAVGTMHARASRGMLSRPTFDEVLAYRERIDRGVAQLLEERGDDERITATLELGLHHEQQHQELILTDIKHAFAQSPLDPVYRPAAAASTDQLVPPEADWVEFDVEIVRIGSDEDTFHFDNETPRHDVLLTPFKIANRPVTNGEYIDFIEAGGYGHAEYWLSDGWAAVNERGWSAPLYWRSENSGWSQLTLNGRREVALDEPVTHVSYYEADAYASWAGARLATEFEWEVVAENAARVGNFAGSGRFHPAAPSTSAGTSTSTSACSPDGVYGLYGDTWEWTRSAYAPYPGFRAADGALGEYNGKFMSSQMVLRGGSCATASGHVRASYRNFFPPDARWQFSGIRLANDG